MLPLSDTDSSGTFPYWVVIFILANIVVFLFQLFVSDPELFIRQYALIPSHVNFSHIQTLLPFISSQFLHGGFFHIISNMWFLRIFGDNVEDRLGYLLFPLLYIVSGVVGGVAQYFIDPYSSIPMLGASGAIAGVLGAYMVFFPHHTIKTLIPFGGLFTTANLPAFTVLVLWLVTQIFNGSASILSSSSSLGGVAFFAHIGGFATGWLLAQIHTKIAPQRNKEFQSF